SAQRDGVRLVGATFGGSSWVERDRHMGALLDQGFSRMGVAPRAPSSVMAAAAAPPRNAPAARPVAQGNVRAAQLAAPPQPQRRPPQQVAAAPNRQNAAPVAYRQPPTPPRPAARPVQRVEQGSATSNTQRSSAHPQQLRAPPRPTQR
ncbi:MAG: hypothetical protein ACKO9A_15660, partial [Alphaproteobacteria bacterium]